MKLDAKMVSLKADTQFIPPLKDGGGFLLNSSLKFCLRKKMSRSCAIFGASHRCGNYDQESNSG